MTITLHSKSEKLAALLPPLLIDAERVAQSVWQGVHGRRRAGVGESFWQFRRYNPGDPAERIDWRQSARTDKIYVREREWEAAQSACLWADMSGSMRYASDKNLPTKAEQAQLLLLALASLLLRGGEKALWGEGQSFIPIQGKAGLERIAGNLSAEYDAKRDAVPLPFLREGLGEGVQRSLFSLPSPDPSRKGGRGALMASIPPLPPKIRHAHMILASDFLMPEGALQQRMQIYAAQNFRGALLHIVDPLEESFALDGRVELQGAEGEDSMLLPNAATLRDAYRQRFAEHQSQLLHIAESAGWFYLRHVTSEPPQQSLLRLYSYLAG